MYLRGSEGIIYVIALNMMADNRLRFIGQCGGCDWSMTEEEGMNDDRDHGDCGAGGGWCWIMGVRL